MVSHWILFLGVISLNVTIVYGQCNATEGPLELNAGSYPQYFISPNYPDQYDDNMDCYWLINAPSTDDRVIINIHETNIKGKSGCQSDYLNLYDGSSNDSALIATVCDQNEQDYNMFVTNGSSLFIWFHSDENGNLRGFRVLYFSNDTSKQPSTCSGTPLVATSTTQYLMSANLPDLYQSNYSCTTYVEAENQFYTLIITIYLLDVEDVNKCPNDRFYVSEGTNTSVLTTISDSVQCTTAFDYEFTDITTQYPVAGISLETDDQNTNYYGFFLGYRQDPLGINLTYPLDGQTVYISIDEDVSTGTVNASTARVDVTSDGTLSIVMQQDGMTTAMDFDYNLENGSYVIGLLNALDYETTTSYLLTFIMSDDINPSLTGTVYFNITLIDVDDNAPVMTNLPGNATVYRSQSSGYSLFNVTSTDPDISSVYQVPAYTIFLGNSDGLLAIDLNTGEITLALAASTVSVSVNSYSVTIAAYSVSVSSGLASFQMFSLYFHPDDPPVCSDMNAAADSIIPGTDDAGTVLSFASPWNCSDEGTILYSLGTASPNLMTPLFTINNDTGVISLTRTFDLTEVPSRQFNLSVIATDFLGQTTTFYVVFGVVTITCSPNPKQIYVRMGSASNTVVASDYNCSHSGLTYSIKSQIPAGTFGMSGSNLVVLSEVYKIRYYSLTLSVSDGTDTIDLAFKVTIQMRQCKNIIKASTAASTAACKWLALVMITIVKWFSVLVT